MISKNPCISKIRYHVCCEFKIPVEENKKSELNDQETTKKLLLDEVTQIAFNLLEQYPIIDCVLENHSHILCTIIACYKKLNTIRGQINEQFKSGLLHLSTFGSKQGLKLKLILLKKTGNLTRYDSLYDKQYKPQHQIVMLTFWFLNA